MIHPRVDLEIQSHRLVLDTIRRNREISGAELARLTRYQPSTIVYILRSLEKRGLIEVSRIGSPLRTAGKPPTLWRLVGDTGYIIGVEIVPGELRAVVLDFSCRVIRQERRTGLENMKGDRVAPECSAFIRDVAGSLRLPAEKIIGVGVALPGLVDRTQGLVRYSRSLQLRESPFQEVLGNELGLAVEIVNGANAGALGIFWNPDEAGDLPPHIVFLTLNEKNGEMGAGLILNNRLYEGMLGTAGEIFGIHKPLSRLMDMGKKRFGADQPLVRIIREKSKVALSDVIQGAAEGCRISEFILRSLSRFIVEEIIRIVEFVNPGLIVIGGDITDARELISEFILTQVDKRLKQIYPAGLACPAIRFSSTGIYSVSMGAGALFLRKIFM